MTPEQHLELGLKHLHDFYKLTGVNSLDNYGYREYGAIEQLKSFLPSIKKVPGRSGDDASAIEDGYFHIEQKSGTIKTKKLSISNFPKGQFDKQSDPIRRDHLFKYDGLSLSCFEPFQPYPVALVFVPKEYMSDLHTLFKDKQEAKIAIFEQKRKNNQNIGRDTIDISLEDILSKVGRSNLICYLRGVRTDPLEFFQILENKMVLNE